MTTQSDSRNGEPTPGPWTFDEEECSNAIYIRHDPENDHATGHEVCSVHDEDGSPITPEILANARLIAAAPELLVALKDIAEGYTGGEITAEDLRDIARRAIVRAEGRA